MRCVQLVVLASKLSELIVVLLLLFNECSELFLRRIDLRREFARPDLAVLGLVLGCITLAPRLVPCLTGRGRCRSDDRCRGCSGSNSLGNMSELWILQQSVQDGRDDGLVIFCASCGVTVDADVPRDIKSRMRRIVRLVRIEQMLLLVGVGPFPALSAMLADDIRPCSAARLTGPRRRPGALRPWGSLGIAIIATGHDRFHSG